MRDNGPVIDRERLMAADQFLVSRTDVRGIILFANQDFIDISGFSRDELIGKPHNLVRHPDMPAEAFADLWDTVRRGQSWIGVVKNRAKDGSYYWVRATVSPLTEDGQTIGFISVRVKPTSAEITAANRAYAEIRAGSRGWSVSRGRLSRTGPATCIRRALAPMSRRIALIVLAMLAIMSAGTAIGLSGLARSNQALADLVGDELGTAVAMQQLGMTCHDAWQHLVLASRPDSDIPAEIAKVKADLAQIASVIASARSMEMDPAETRFNADLSQRIRDINVKLIDPAIALAEAGKRGSLAALLADKGIECLQPIDELTSRQAQLQLDQGRGFVVSNQTAFRIGFIAAAVLAAATLAIGLATAWLIPRAVRRNLGGLRSGMDDLARDQLDTPVDLDRADEFGPVNLAFVALQTRIRYAKTSEREQRAQMLREFDESIGQVVKRLTEAVGSLKANAEQQSTASTQMSANAQAVATAAGEMSASVREIASQANQASSLARTSVDTAGGSRDTMDRLSKAAHEITAVAKLIADIAEQTNLLALNATIEAARAGELGRGFAVVAGEVKSLASQTQGATGDINRRITAVQTDTQAAASALETLVAGVGRLNDAAHAIAAAVEEQAAVTEDIARNADQAAASARLTGETAAAVAAAAAAIASSDEELERAVSVFKRGTGA